LEFFKKVIEMKKNKIDNPKTFLRSSNSIEILARLMGKLIAAEFSSSNNKSTKSEKKEDTHEQ